MSLIRARQGAITRLFPHNANDRFIIPARRFVNPSVSRLIVGNDGMTRYFLDGTMHVTIPPWTAIGLPYVMEATVVFLPGAAAVQYVMSDSAGNDHSIRNGGGAGQPTFFARYVENLAFLDLQGDRPGDPVTVRFEANVGDARLLLNSVEVDTGPVSDGPQQIEFLGSNNSPGAFMFGALANISLTDINNPANSRFYPFNDGAGPTVVESLNGQDGTIQAFNAASWNTPFTLGFRAGVYGQIAPGIIGGQQIRAFFVNLASGQIMLQLGPDGDTELPGTLQLINAAAGGFNQDLIFDGQRYAGINAALAAFIAGEDGNAITVTFDVVKS